jgi:hypothetical protein
MCATSAEFGLHVGNVKFSTKNEEYINIRRIICRPIILTTFLCIKGKFHPVTGHEGPDGELTLR